MLPPPTPGTETPDLELEYWRERANENGDVPPSVVRDLFDALTSKEEEIARLKARQHHFKDEDWPLALQRLKHMEPGPDQGLAVVGTDDLEFALERLAHFAEVAMGNAVAVSTAEARALSLEAQVEGLKRALACAQSVIDGAREDLHSQRAADWFPEGVHDAATSMSEAMRLIGNRLADVDLEAALASLGLGDQEGHSPAPPFLDRMAAAPSVTQNTAWDGDEGREGRRGDEDEAAPPQAPVSGDGR